VEELKLLIKSRHPILTVETPEEERLIRLLAVCCADLRLAFFTWSVTEGLFRYGFGTGIYDTADAAKALKHIRATTIAAVYLLRDFTPYLDTPEIVRSLRDVAEQGAEADVTIVLSAPVVELPPELRSLAARYLLALPGEVEIRRAMFETLLDLSRNQHFVNRLSEEDTRRFVANLRGLTLAEIRSVVSSCVLDDDVLDASDLPRALAAKRDRAERSGVLEFVDPGEEVSPLGGLCSLKAWLDRARAGYSERARELGLSPPRGVMFVGVQGCGKSLAAKTVARQWEVPLVRLDPGRLFDKYIGESEKRLREAFAAAEAVAPVVLWIDEIEKAFAGSGASDADAGVSRRLFGEFLTWLQEKTVPVFVAATANDLSAVPPELLRKGRFDEIFFIDLPDDDERREIFTIHLERRKQEPSRFDLGALVKASDGFSGAEIEQAVVTALYGLLAEGEGELTTQRIVAELERTVPLSRSRAEDVAALRGFARERFVPAR
jgi:ATPase family associated with various cellular activities (AAA)